MSEFGFSFVVLQLLHFFFFLLSHPLYFSYFIFFFPYFLKLLSFLSPLFITTFLLLFAFFSLFLSDLPQFSDSSKMGFLATTYQVVFDSLRPRTPEEIHEFQEELEAYKIVFETYTFGTEQNPYEKTGDFPGKILDRGEDFPEKISSSPENPLTGIEEKIGELEGKKIEIRDLRKGTEESSISSRSESSPWNSPAKILDFPEKINSFPENPSPLSGIEEKTGEKIEIRNLRKGSEESSISSRSESSPWSSPGSLSLSLSRENSLGSYGSMRKEKEWRRTLACKLFEERHNSEGSEEGMDSLWETYENRESSKKKTSGKSKRGKKIEEDEDEDEDEEEGQLCCLQALKFSAGKTNLVKMTKALKGFGWLSRNKSRKRLIL